jgi:immune inhibitor A
MQKYHRRLISILLGIALLVAGCAGFAPLNSPAGIQPQATVPAPGAPTGAPLPTNTVAAAQSASPAPVATGLPITANPSITTTIPVSANAGIPLRNVIKPVRDLRTLAMQLEPGKGNIPLVVNATPPVYKVGDTARFWIQNEDTQVHQQITATLMYETPHAYMWVEQGVTLNQAALEQSANLFENKTYPTDHKYFGSEWSPGVDDDVHLSILNARGLGHNVGGYFSAADEFSRLANPYSNEREMFYISADPGGPQPGTAFYDGVLAHEFQHMIHWAHHRNEDSWVNEGMSVLAMHLNGFDTGSPDTVFSQLPGTQLNTWADPSTDPTGDAEHYGASYLFMDYFLSRFGADLLKARVSAPQDSIAGFNDVLAQAGRPERFDGIFADWLVANLVNQPKAAPQGHYGYTDLTPPPPAIATTYQNFPAQGAGQVNQYGADYIALRPSSDLTINFVGQPSVSLVNTKPTGHYAWYSNRGDDDSTTLTRNVDLSKVTTATLTFSAWYNLEDGWDYTYVQASTDGGQHWQILPGLHTSNTDKSGNAYGPGWTGNSGGGQTPQWIDERVDLSGFAGKQIQLRFDTITDDAYNGPGFLLDNIAIPQIGFKDGAENGINGWQAAGWVLTDNTLPQQWLVEAVAQGPNGLQVQQMQVGADGKGQLTLAGAANDSNVALIISAMAPVTTDPASFQYTIVPSNPAGQSALHLPR